MVLTSISGRCTRLRSLRGVVVPLRRPKYAGTLLAGRMLSDDVCLLRVLDDIDIASAPKLRRALNTKGRHIIDLTACRYIDSSGLAVLIGRYKLIGERLPIITPLTSTFRRLIRVTGLETLFALFETIDEAGRLHYPVIAAS